jgi:hypothetical protein
MSACRSSVRTNRADGCYSLLCDTAGSWSAVHTGRGSRACYLWALVRAMPDVLPQQELLFARLASTATRLLVYASSAFCADCDLIHVERALSEDVTCVYAVSLAVFLTCATYFRGADMTCAVRKYASLTVQYLTCIMLGCDSMLCTNARCSVLCCLLYNYP